MSYSLITNLILLISIIVIIILVVRKLPQALGQQDNEAKLEFSGQAQEALQEKGLPAKTAGKIKAWSKIASYKTWQFILEAKGLKHAPKIHYNFKKILRKETSNETKPPIARGEKYYINLIKRHPKDLGVYDQLGQFYIEAKRFEDAINVYEYLAEHSPTSSSYFAKLGLSALHLQDFVKAEKAYAQSVKLDKSHPNRFYNLALAWQGQGKWTEAMHALDSALELDKNNQKYHDLRFEFESKAKIQKQSRINKESVDKALESNTENS